MSEFDFKLDFASAADRIRNEREERRALVARELKFHVSFLDDALGGILPHDLVMLGARTGAGKTEFASIVAQENARCGKRVTYFALEAEPKEIERRIKYRTIAALLYEHGAYVPRGVSYRNWYRGLLDDAVTRQIEEEAADRFSSLTRLVTYYRGAQFTGDDLERTFYAIQDQTDLIVLDHLHYVDIVERDENQGQKALVKRIRDLSLTMGLPILLVAHLRKKQQGGPRIPRLLPEVDDFHGSSDITKIATKCIVIGPDPSNGPGHWRTLMQVVKDRMDGSLPRYVACLDFDLSLGLYSTQYQIGHIEKGAFAPIGFRSQLPLWADNAVVPDQGDPPVEDPQLKLEASS